MFAGSGPVCLFGGAGNCMGTSIVSATAAAAAAALACFPNICTFRNYQSFDDDDDDGDGLTETPRSTKTKAI